MSKETEIETAFDNIVQSYEMLKILDNDINQLSITENDIEKLWELVKREKPLLVTYKNNKYYCSKCGNNIHLKNKYCSKCGIRLSKCDLDWSDEDE